VLRDGLQKWDSPDLVTDEGHYTLRIALSPDKEQVWRRVKKRARQLTSQALRAGVEVIDGTEAFDRYYPAYSRSMRDKGTPTLGIRFFQAVLAEFPDLFLFLVVRHEDRVIGGGFVTPFQDTVYCTWGGMLRRFYDLKPNHALYWQSIQYGVEGNFQWLDLGRSRKDSGSFVFKMNWGAEPRPLYQQYYLNDIAHPPAVGSGREEDASYKAFVSIWKRLPLPVTEWLGPRLRKRMPFG
jgi:lipid II:glycine glycyltransferase (peptidoglycan interpeptide bridge formation enzyme)